MRTGGFKAALAAAALMLTGCATASSDSAGANAAPAPAYYVMRHLEKGEGADPGLSAAGAANAQRLAAGFFGSRAKPRAIFVSPTRRARETAAPLAARLGLTPREYNPADTASLVAQVRAEPGPVLVVGHSNTVPDIVAQLGGTRPEPLSDSDYGTVWLVAKDGRTEQLAL